MSNAGAVRYGELYWCVKSPLSENGDIYLNADSVEIRPRGDLVFWSDKRDGKLRDAPMVLLIIAAGQWTACFAASVMDGHAVAVDHWKGEIAE